MSFYNCEIKFKDEEAVFISLIKDSLDIDDSTDEQVFFYCNSVSDIELLMEEDNGEDFIVLSYEKQED